MSTFRKRLKRKALKKNVEIKNAVNLFIQPFKELPCLGDDNASRLNAHDLFSFYTADIIKEDIIFSR